jgi:hypothetical protein
MRQDALNLYKIRQNAGHFRGRSNCFCIVESSKKYCVADQQCRGKSFLLWRGNTERFVLLPTVQFNCNTKESYCCVSMATVGTRTLHIVTLYVQHSTVQYLSSCTYGRKVAQGQFCLVSCHPESPSEPFVYHSTD